VRAAADSRLPPPVGMDPWPATLDAVLTELQELRAEVRDLRDGRGQGGSLLTIQEAASLLRLSPAALRKRVERGQVPAHRFGRSWRVRRRDLIPILGRGA
jgi:excisionase family DNA binding protein